MAEQHLRAAAAIQVVRYPHKSHLRPEESIMTRVACKSAFGTGLANSKSQQALCTTLHRVARLGTSSSTVRQLVGTPLLATVSIASLYSRALASPADTDCDNYS